MNTPNTGLFITRGQPLHNGHLSALKQGIQSGLQKIILGIGSADKEMTPNNPFSYEQREFFAHSLLDCLKKEFPSIETALYPIMDFGNNAQRRSYIEEALPSFDTIITGNPIVKQARSDKHIFTPEKTSMPYRGTHIRYQIQQADRETLKQSVPEVIIGHLQALDAPRIMQSINQLQPQLPKLAADIIATYQGKIILIKRKYAPYGLALPGGMMDEGEQLYQTARREGLEELFDKDDPDKALKISTNHPLFTLDKPNRDPRGRVISFVFEATVTGGTPKASDDADEFHLFDPEEIAMIPDSDFAFLDHKESVMKRVSMKK